MDEPVIVAGLPFALRWGTAPMSSDIAGETVRITAGERTDLFASPQRTAPAIRSAPRLLGDPGEGDFLLSARVTVDFAADFDAGALVLFANDDTWAKVCLEYSPQGRAVVVSVVTRGLSDDCNSFAVEGSHVWLRIARLGEGFAFHASTDGEWWHFVRQFSLDGAGAAALGFLAQAPTGEKCTVEFDQISFARARLANLRSGE